MSWKNTVSRLALVVGTTAVLTGCSSQTAYFQITEPASGNIYYTTKYERAKDDSYLRFTNAETDAKISLKQFEVRTISEEQFTTATQPPASADATPDE